ncbi:MAG: type I restriction-modification system subunit M N-terminal domain-containing protein, partial [Thermodesulfobacteriota bacterium]
MTTQITQQEINDILWKVCDSFRGTVDSTEYKDYILTLFYIKRSSGVKQFVLNRFLVIYSQRIFLWKTEAALTQNQGNTGPFLGETIDRHPDIAATGVRQVNTI